MVDGLQCVFKPLGHEPAEHPTHSSHTTNTRQTHAETAPVLVMRSPKQPAKLAMLLLLAFLLLCDEVGNVHGKTIHENSIDLHALLDFKKGIINDPPALSNWNTTAHHFCRWNGVTCTMTRPFRVSSLNLSGQNLQGQITPSLGNLTFLETLDLSNNTLVGPLPPLNNLRKLQILYLNNNFLQGIIPSETGFLSNLEALDLSFNSLVGPLPSLGNLQLLQNLMLHHNHLQGIIPDALTNCSNLTNVDLSFNSLVGEIPPKLGFLPYLLSISFASNHLEGSIPDELGQLPALQYLLLGDNKLSGEFPHGLLNLSTSLKILSLESNMLGKALPPNIGDLRSLVRLTMGTNMFEGHVPASLGNATGLEVIDLSRNRFTGKIPTSFGNLSDLTILNLESNKLEARDNQGWEFLNAMRHCRSLKVFSLSSNKLQGSIPQSVGNLSPSLNKLVLAGNSLSGQVPMSIGKLSSLTELGLSENKLSGITEGWIRNLKSLQLLNLQSNLFTGQIPSSISNLTHMTYLYLDDNEFEGLIPASLGNIPLKDLTLSYNNLQGDIPPNFDSLQKLIHLDLSHNSLQGDIPQFGNLEQLGTLDLSSNKLTGQIPDSLGQCYGLVTLQMDQNFLTGNIPVNFGNLSSLGMLNLSHNNLSGTIPSTLNKIQSLYNLDLSYNDLQGQIPRNGVFENATAVSLEGNPGLCGGAKNFHMVSCTIGSRKSEKLYYLIKVLIPIFGFMSVVLLVYFLLLEKKMRRTDETPSSLGDNFLKVSYADLAQATTNFSESNLIGRGGYGSVYRGKLKEYKVEVAVKVFNLEMHGAEKSFLKECEALRSIQHRNLLPILTACSTVDNTGTVFKALVYEFIPNGNLDTWLHQREEGKPAKHLNLAQRLSIAVNMADALDYLHHDCGRTTIHCDLKPSNILLDDDMNALLGDFGIASFYQQDSWSTSAGSICSSSVGVKGTIGYIAPEYAGGGRHASTSGDVYGFGIILLEMMTGKRPTDPMFEDGVSIVHFVDSNFPDEIVRVIDANLVEGCKDIAQASKISDNYVHECLVSVLQLALSCTHPIPSERMSMKEIASKMHTVKTSYIGRKAQERASLEFE
ncbi:hypothetical protein ACQ4PT_043467 [Festuca glaucescens]